MTNTENLNLARLVANQESAEVTFNSTINALDALVFLAVESIGDTAPPGSPSDGDAYVVGTGATGAWAGEDGKLAFYYGGWNFRTVREGFTARVLNDGVTAAFDGAAWNRVRDGSSQRDVVVRVDSPQVGSQHLLEFTFEALNVLQVRSVRSGGTSVTWNLKHGTSRASGVDVYTTDQATTSTTSGNVDASGFNDETVPSGRFLWWECSAVSGSVDWIELVVSVDESPIA